MAGYSATVPAARPAEEVFAYLADFRSVAEWDPLLELGFRRLGNQARDGLERELNLVA